MAHKRRTRNADPRPHPRAGREGGEGGSTSACRVVVLSRRRDVPQRASKLSSFGVALQGEMRS